MADRYQHRRKTTSGIAPTTLLVGEFATNLADGQVWVGQADGSPKPLAEMAAVAAGMRAIIGATIAQGSNVSLDVNPTTGVVTISATGGGGGGGFRRGIRLGFIGTSLIQNNIQSSSSQVSHSSRGWISWARFFSRGRFFTPVWYDPSVYSGWEPGGVAGATRYFRGLNAGVSGQTIAQIAARKEFLAAAVDCDMIVIDGGTNDIDTLTATEIQDAREALAEYFLGLGIPVVLLPILARSTAQWPGGDVKRQKAAWINQRSRDFCKGREACWLYDWNQPWADLTGSYVVPKAGYSNDGLHKAPPGGVAVGEDFANFLADILPPAQPRVWAQDDQYSAANNPFGNLLSNPFCLGTGGSLTGATGVVANNMRIELVSGGGAVVGSKEARADGRGEYQVITITPGSTDTTARFRTANADMATTFPVDTWLQASCEVEISAHAYIRGVTLTLWDVTGGVTVSDMSPDQYTTPAVRWPNRTYKGLLETPAIRVSTANPTFRWRVDIVLGNTTEGASGDLVVKVGAVEFRPVEDPRGLVGYTAG